jgi:phosphoglycolate phosphatase
MVVFDWNGTLLDDAERTLVALNATLSALRMAPLDDEAFRHAFKLPMEEFIADLGIPRAEIAPALDAWQRGIEEREAPLAPGAAEALRALWEQGRPAGVISAGFTAGVELDASRHGIRQWLAFLHGSVRSKSEVLRQVIVPGQPLV